MRFSADAGCVATTSRAATSIASPGTRLKILARIKIPQTISPFYQLEARAKSGATVCTALAGRAGEGARLRVPAADSARTLLPFIAQLEAKGRREGRAPAAPVGPCATGMHTGWTDRVADRPAFPARMVLTVSFVLSPGSDALLPPSPGRSMMRAPGRAATSPRGLTHRPRASGPHDFSVRGRSGRNHRGLACAHPR